MKRMTSEMTDAFGVAHRKRGRWVCSVHVGVRGVVEFKCFGRKKARRVLDGMVSSLAGPAPKPGPRNVSELSCKLLESCGINPLRVREFKYSHKVGDMPTVSAVMFPDDLSKCDDSWPRWFAWKAVR